MLTQKILSRTVALAMTASMTVLAGCPNTVVPVTTPTPSDSSSPAVSGSPAVSATPVTTATATPVVTATPVGSGSASATATPSATTSTTPSGSTGGSDIKELATFNGKVFDRNGVPVDDASVTAISSDPGVTFTAQPQTTVGGSYVFRNAPVGSRILVTVTKPGWTTRVQTVVLKSNLTGDPSANVLNFGTDNTTTSNGAVNGSVIYAIQDEPEVTSLKINDRPVPSAFVGDRISSNSTLTNNTGSSSLLGVTPTNLGLGNNTLPGDGSTTNNANTNSNVGLLDSVLDPSLTGVASNTLKVEMTFSEAVDRASVEQNFRIRSQNYTSNDRQPQSTTNNTKNFTISNQSLTTDDITYTWSADDTMLTIQTKRGILTNSNNSSDEFRYLVDFQQQFEDKTNKKARSHSAFRFSPSQVNDFAVFSTADDNVTPQLTSVVARDGSTADTLELSFSEDMDVISQTSPTARLTDTFSSNNSNSLSFANVFDSVGGFNGGSYDNTGVIPSNGATILTFADTSDSNSNPPISKTNYSYMIGKILRQQINNVTSSNSSSNSGGVINNNQSNSSNTQQQENINVLRLLPLGFTSNNTGNGQFTSGNNNGSPANGTTNTSLVAGNDYTTINSASANGNPFAAVGTQQGTTGNAIRDVRVTGNKVLIELDSTAFQTGDQIIVAAGNNITGSFTYQSGGVRTISIQPNLAGITGFDNNGNAGQPVIGPSRFRDPAGNEIDRGNSGTINNVTATNAQKSAIVN